MERSCNNITQHKIVFVFLWSWTIVLGATHAFTCSYPAPFRSFVSQQQQHDSSSSISSSVRTTRLYMAVSNTDSDDPFVVLGLNPTSDKREIKRAYKRLALKFHPDMVTNKDSTEAEKKAASDRFAKINWAYGLLSGKESSSAASGAGASSRSSSSSSSGGGGWTPPHRRQGNAYSGSSSSSSSDDWTDYVNNYRKQQDEEYDAGGDSFGAIFADLMKGAAVGAASYSAGGSPGIFRDFVEFLENNVDGSSYAGGGGGGGIDDDSQLRILLATGTIEEIGEEMDDSDLIIQQLSTKTSKLLEEIAVLQAEQNQSDIRYSKKMDIQIQLDELEARKRVYDGYIKKAKKRLLALQTRYKELIVNGGNDDKAGGGRGRDNYGSSSYSSGSDYSSSNRSSNYRTNQQQQQQQQPRADRTSTTSGTKKDEESWRTEGFGSYGRGRGSSRRGSSSRRRRTQQSTSSSPSPSPSPSTTSYSNNDTYSTRSSSSRNTGDSRSYQTRRETTTASSSSSSSSSASSGMRRPTSYSSGSSSEGYVPPHRRSSSYESQVDQDKRRLRELQVDDEFEKLKKELGL